MDRLALGRSRPKPGPVRSIPALLLVLPLLGCAEPAPPVEPPLEPEAEPPALEAPVEPRGDWIDVDAESLAPLLRARPERALLVNVWSTWCEPCVEEMPGLLRAARAYEGRGLGLVLISTDAPSNRDGAATFLRGAGASLPSYFKRGSDDAFVRAVHPEWSGALPVTVLFDRERHARHLWNGPVDAATLREPIETLLERESGER